MNIKKELNLTMFTFAVISIIIGVVLIVFNKAFATIIPYVIGALVLVDGVFALIKYFTIGTRDIKNSMLLFRGITDVVLGILILLSSEFFVTALGILVGIFLLLWGVFKLNYSCLANKVTTASLPEIIEGVIFMIAGIIMLIFSKRAIELIVLILGACILAIGLYVAIKTFIANKKLADLKKKVNDVCIETTTVDENKNDGNVIETQVAKEDK